MNKKYIVKILFIILCFFLYTNGVKAECTTSELNTLKELAEQIDFGYEFDDKYKYFKIKAYNLTPETQIVLGYSTYKYDAKRKEPANIQMESSFISGNKYTFTIYATNKTKCTLQELTTKTITLPVYNIYSTRNECKGIEIYSLCRKWYDSTNLTEEEFINNVNKYKEKINNEKKTSVFNNIINFIITYWYVFIIIIIIVLIIVLVKLIISKKKTKIQI